ncbi:bile acid:sodium symporter family protein [Microlunatus soli]|uniref:Solute carrier family 10 (Sodium/bile acid cotransporter), member 7 n=1 Tax=Microlunatus soli TaxID=630515 RepID=A0A1H1ZSP4_9ACTN|nr:bile acid:sodium symporter family protein [Microlunatus soli]SDT36617.1 solute carrier family 10 (sodium/bile acid cotransporter), member 7 [Microlunatus soli]
MALRLRLPGWLDLFIVSLLAAILLATVLPVRGTAATVFDHLTTAAVCILFFLHGAKLSPTNALHSFTRWRFQLLVLGFTFVAFPLLGLAMLPLKGSLLTPTLFAGVIFLCILPSTVQSSIAFTSIARGNVGLAVSSASVSNVLGVVITPLLAALLLGSEAKITAGSVVGILLQLLLPFVIGQLLHRRVGPWLAAHKPVINIVDRGSILLVVYTAFSAGVVEGLWRIVAPPTLAAIIGLSIVLLAVVIGLTFAIGRLTRMSREDRVVLLFCGSKKSLASGLPMATLLFPSSTVGMIVLPVMIFHLIQLIVCAVLARVWARRAEVQVLEPSYSG